MTKIQVRRDTSSNWTSNNPTPASGEMCYETDTGKLKIGNGSTPYTNLPYIGDSGSTGTTDYTQLTNKPQINNVELQGNKTLAELGVQPAGNYLTEVPAEYVTETELNSKGYITSSALADYATVDTVEGLENEVAGINNNKQDKFNANTPLNLFNIMIPKYTGFEITDNSFTTPNNDINLTYPTSSTPYSTNGSFYYPLPYYVAIPFTNNHTYKVPKGVRIFTGHFQDDSIFLCTGGGMVDAASASSTEFGLFEEFQTLEPNKTFSILMYNDSDEKASNSLTLDSEDAECVYIQLCQASEHITIQCYNSSQAWTCAFYNNDLNYTPKDFLDNTDTVLIFPKNKTTYNTNMFQDYATTTRNQWTQAGYNDFMADRGDNLFSWSGSIKAPELNLNYDTATLGVNDSNQLYVKEPNLLEMMANAGIVTNFVLSWGTQKPTTDGTSVTVYSGTKLVCPVGYSEDGKPKNEIYTLTEDKVITPTSNLILLAVRSGNNFNCSKFYIRANQSVPADKPANSWLYSKKDNRNYQYATTPTDPTFNQYDYIPAIGLIKSGATITDLVLNDNPFLGVQLYNTGG